MPKKISEESVPVEELKTPTALPVHRFFKSIAVILLSFICVFVGVLIYRLHVPTDGTAVKSVQSPARETAMKRAKKHGPYRDASRMLRADPVAVAAPTLKTTAATLTMPLAVSDKPEAPVLETPKESVVEPVDVGVENPLPAPLPKAEKNTLPMDQMPRLMLEEALQLRDNLRAGEPCLEQVQILMKSALPVEHYRQQLMEHLLPVCSGGVRYENLNEVFLSNRHDALAAYYHMTSSNRWTAYMKILGTSLIDVRRLNPVKQRPKDMISMAQNALNRHDLKQALANIEKLPPELSAKFRSFKTQANLYLGAEEAVERLILSFEKQGRAL